MSSFVRSGGNGFGFDRVTAGVGGACIMKLPGSTGLTNSAEFGLLLYTAVQMTRAK